MLDLPGELEREGDLQYHEWLLSLNASCLRFLDIELESFHIESCDIYEWYCNGMTPEAFLQCQILPELRADAGTDFIDSIIAQMTKFGCEARRKL